MSTARIVEALDELEDSNARFGLRLEATPIEQLAFERGEEALRHRVVVSVSDRSHRGANTRLPTSFAELDRGILRALIRMVDHAVRPSLPERHVEGIEHHLRVQGGRHRPADDPAAEGIEHDRQIEEAGPCRNIRDISHPQHIGPIRCGGDLEIPFRCSMARFAGAFRQLAEHPYAFLAVGEERRLADLFKALADDPDNEYAMIDATIVRSHQHSAGAQATPPASDQAIGRSRGGLTTKIHVIVDALGNPLALSLTGGQVHDITQAETLTAEIEPGALLADKGYANAVPFKVTVGKKA